jgi:uncharacterized protein (DUF362 family)
LIAASIAGDRFSSRRGLDAFETELVERYAAMQPRVALRGCDAARTNGPSRGGPIF